MLIGISGYAGSGKDTAGKMIQYFSYVEKTRAIPLLAKHPDALVPLSTWLRDDFHSAVRQNESGWQIKKFADALREVAHRFLPQFTLEFLYTDEFKEMELEGWEYETQVVELDENNQDHTVMKTMTGRQFLQWLGTDAIRNGLHRDAWVKALMSEYRPLERIKFKDTSGYNWDLQYNKELDGPEHYPNWIITDVRFPNELRAVKRAGGYTIRLSRLPKWIDGYTNPDTIEAWKASLHESETALDNAKFDFMVSNHGTIDELTAQLETIMNQIHSNEQRRQTESYPVRRAG